MRRDPRCPNCGWMLQFWQDPIYPEYNEWEGFCPNQNCKTNVVRPSDAAWKERNWHQG